MKRKVIARTFHNLSKVELLSLIHISEPTETVLDLVCRLLLENKKKNKKN